MSLYAVLVLAVLVNKAYQQECSYTFQVPQENAQSTCPQEALDTLEMRVAELEAMCGTGSSGGSGSGVNYIRYGNTECPAGAQLVYDGYMAGAHYTHGGGVNYLCLPKEDIEWPVGAKISHQSGSYVYGTEFQWQSSIDTLQGKHDQDILCAVCDASSKSQKLLMPARTSCPTGWTLEYSGLLMSSHSSHSDRDFICVDTTLEARPGSSLDQNGALIYVVEVRCGSLPCPPYEQGKEITCAICTK